MFQEKLGEMISGMVISYRKHKYFVVQKFPVKTGKSQDGLAFIAGIYRVCISATSLMTHVSTVNSCLIFKIPELRLEKSTFMNFGM